LKYLEQQDILRVHGTTNPKKYKIVPIEKIDIKQVLKEGL
jgi:hypothetical protein